MARIKANGIELEYEDHGDPSDPAIVLIMGLAAQLTHWPPAFIEDLVKAGFRVVAFDNRDIGLSEKLHTKRALKPTQMALARAVGLKGLAPYTLEDMAKDVVGLKDSLHIDRAHIIGVSMGGMIGQVLTSLYGPRVKSFVPIMSSTNNPKLPKAAPSILKEIFAVRTRPRTREELIDRTINIWNMIGTKDSGNDPEQFRERIAAAVDRCNYPAGVRRQIAAIIASGDLRSWTRKITAPTLVVHGKEDPLAPYTGGKDIAETIEGAKLELIDGMGHDLPPKHLPTITKLVIDHLRSVEEDAASAEAA